MFKIRYHLALTALLLAQGPAAHAEQVAQQQQQQQQQLKQVLKGSSQFSQNISKSKPVITYTARYDRYGVFGVYHVTLVVNTFRDGVHQQKVYIDGAGRPTKTQLDLGFCKLKFRLPPAYLAAYVNPQGYKKHFMGLLTSNEFGPTFYLNEAEGTKLISMAHHAMTTMNSNTEMFYSTIPIHIGPVQFWTSNSVVASLVKSANEDGIKLPFPTDGFYPGFNGPYLQSTHFKAGTRAE